MFYAPNYTTALRCIGQMLESRNIDIFELTAEADGFVVEFADPNPPYTSILRLHYSPDQITMLDRDGQAHRTRVKSDLRFDSLPEILRATGKYIDGKRGELRRLSNCSESAGGLEIQYQTRERELRSENLSTSLIHEIAVNMYKQRNRISNPINIITR